MKIDPHPTHRAAWLLLAVPALAVTPSWAQDAPAAPPPVRATVPQATPAPATQTPPPSRETGRAVENIVTDTQSKTVLSPEAQAALDEAKARKTPARPAARAAAPVARQVTRTTTTRTTTTERAASPTQSAPAQSAAPAPAARSVTPAAPQAVPPAPVAAPPAETFQPPFSEPTEPAGQAITTATTTQSTEQRAPIWPWILGALVLIGAGIAFFTRRRKAPAFAGQYEPEADYYSRPEEIRPLINPDPIKPVAVEAEVPVVAAAPLLVTPAVAPTPADTAVPDREPVMSEAAAVVDAQADDVAALTEGVAPVRDRPWLEFAMRPVRAGTNADEAMVEIELTVANSGSIPAENVRVSTFMLTDAGSSDMERMLIDPPADTAARPVTIAPGEGARIDATLAALKADLDGSAGFTPVVVADARYRLPDGSEGRTSASFLVGVSSDGGTLIPLDLADRVMREDVEARLHGEPQHA